MKFVSRSFYYRLKIRHSADDVWRSWFCKQQSHNSAEMPFKLQFKREVPIGVGMRMRVIFLLCAIEQKQRRTRRATRLKSIKSIF